MYSYTYVYMYISVYVHLFTNIYIYIYIYICIFVCTYIYTCVYLRAEPSFLSCQHAHLCSSKQITSRNTLPCWRAQWKSCVVLPWSNGLLIGMLQCVLQCVWQCVSTCTAEQLCSIDMVQCNANQCIEVCCSESCSVCRSVRCSVLLLPRCYSCILKFRLRILTCVLQCAQCVQYMLHGVPQ